MLDLSESNSTRADFLDRVFAEFARDVVEIRQNSEESRRYTSTTRSKATAAKPERCSGKLNFPKPKPLRKARASEPARRNSESNSPLHQHNAIQATAAKPELLAPRRLTTNFPMSYDRPMTARHLIAVLLLLCQFSCSTSPLKDAVGHAPFQWGKVNDSLTADDLQYLSKLTKGRWSKPVRVSDEFAEAFLKKLHGPVRKNFTGNELSKEMWVVNESGKSYEFYRLYHDEEGEERYLSTGYRSDGVFYSGGGGAGKPW